MPVRTPTQLPIVEPVVLKARFRMPHMGGDELGRRVGTSRPEIPVLYMTGFALEVEWELPEDIRSTRLILKPFRGEALLERVAGSVSRK